MKFPQRSTLVFSIAALSAGCTASEKEPETQVNSTAEVASSETVTHNYRCESGEAISAQYVTTDSAIVQYKGKTYRMQIAISGSGARYVDNELEWWTKGSGAGSEGTLFHHLADGTSGDRIESCTES